MFFDFRITTAPPPLGFFVIPVENANKCAGKTQLRMAKNPLAPNIPLTPLGRGEGDGGVSSRCARRPEEGKNRLAPAGENDDDIGVDRKPVTHGNQDASDAPALLARTGKQEQAMNGVYNTKNRPLFGLK
jgi:hypothetical protein